MKGVMNSWTKRMVFLAPGTVTMFFLRTEKPCSVAHMPWERKEAQISSLVRPLQYVQSTSSYLLITLKKATLRQ